MSEAAIRVEGLTKKFGDFTAVDHLSMSVPKGVIYGFLGPNGSGKTTTIRMMCGLLTPDEGEGEALGHDILTEGRAIKKRVGYMTQRFSLYEELSVRENLEFMARMYGEKDVKGRVREVMTEYGLDDRARQLAAQLSGGWKQRLALAASMIHRPDLLLLDEPTAGVDPAARRHFWERIHDMTANGITVLVSTHYMDEAIQCDHICFIHKGKKLIDAPAADIPAESGLVTWRIKGPHLDRLADEMKALDSVEQAARFGDSLHVSGLDAAALERDLAPYRQRDDLQLTEREPGLEEVFIHLIESREGDPEAKPGEKAA